MKLKISLSIFFFFFKSAVSPTQEFIDLKNIRQVLKNDRLEDEAVKQKEEQKRQGEKKFLAKTQKYQFPSEMEFWSFFSEYWLVKNATILKWDFKKPDYGIELAFQKLLESLGIYEKKFKILLLKTPQVAHFALPSNVGERILLFSLPFKEALDLSQQEVALLLLEDYLRLEKGHLRKMIKIPELEKALGGNFFKEKKWSKDILEKISKKYDEIIFDKGFNFKQQFEITRKMDMMLKSNSTLWNSYYQLVIKIDRLVKTNPLYKNYSKIYPSPELQRGWLKPPKN